MCHLDTLESFNLSRVELSLKPVGTKNPKRAKALLLPWESRAWTYWPSMGALGS